MSLELLHRLFDSRLPPKYIDWFFENNKIWLTTIYDKKCEMHRRFLAAKLIEQYKKWHSTTPQECECPQLSFF